MTGYNAMESQGKLQEAPFTEYLQDITNVKVNFTEIIEGSVFEERQNLILASGDLPDVIMYPWGMSAQSVYTYGRQGTLIGLKDLAEKHMPDFIKEINTYPVAKGQIYFPDGEIYALPNWEASCFHCTMSAKMWVYKPWAEKLGHWMPETTDEFYQMLKDFKEKDPNGNGKADEIPLMGNAFGGGGWNNEPIKFLMNSFIYTQDGTYGGYLYRENGKLTFVANTDEWREGLRYMNKLVEEGLLAADSFVQRNEQLKAVAENPGDAILGAAPGGWYGTFVANGAGTGRFADFHPISPLEGPNGVRFSRYQPQAVRYHTKITKAAPRPDIITQWANWWYQDWIEHGKYAGRFMQEGEHWRWATDEDRAKGVVSRDGLPAITISLKVQTYGADRPDTGWTRTSIGWGPHGDSGMPLEWADDPSKQEWRLMVATRDLMQPYKPAEGFMPPNLIIDASVEDELADLNETIASNTGVIQNWSTQFIIGQRNINSDAEWNAYVDELGRAGVDRYLEIWQDTLTNAGY
jgi:putative aldouronate transport system substrate-binding protein